MRVGNNLLFLRARNIPHYERIIYRSATDCLQCFHDFRMVRTAQINRCRAVFKRLAPCLGHPTLLVCRVVRVLIHDSCQPHRCSHQRGTIQPYPTESHTRSRVTHRVHHHRHHGFQDRDIPLEPHRFIHIYRACRVFCLQKVVFFVATKGNLHDICGLKTGIKERIQYEIL